MAVESGIDDTIKLLHSGRIGVFGPVPEAMKEVTDDAFYLACEGRALVPDFDKAILDDLDDCNNAPCYQAHWDEGGMVVVGWNVKEVIE